MAGTLHLLNLQTPIQPVSMVIYNAALKLAEFIPSMFLLSSQNLVAIDIFLGK